MEVFDARRPQDRAVEVSGDARGGGQGLGAEDGFLAPSDRHQRRIEVVQRTAGSVSDDVPQALNQLHHLVIWQRQTAHLVDPRKRQVSLALLDPDIPARGTGR